MVTELPPPPAPLVERLEASFPLPAELAPYEYLWASEGEPSPESAPVEPEDPVRLASSESALPHPIKLLLDRLGFSTILHLKDDRAAGVDTVYLAADRTSKSPLRRTTGSMTPPAG